MEALGEQSLEQGADFGRRRDGIAFHLGFDVEDLVAQAGPIGGPLDLEVFEVVGDHHQVREASVREGDAIAGDLDIGSACPSEEERARRQRLLFDGGDFEGLGGRGEERRREHEEKSGSCHGVVIHYKKIRSENRDTTGR